MHVNGGETSPTGHEGAPSQIVYDDVRIRKVKMLGDRARADAESKGLSGEDLVILKTRIHSLPQYEIEKIDGSPIAYLHDRMTKK